MKKNWLKVLFALMTIGFLFASCEIDSNDNTSVITPSGGSSGGGGSGSTPAPATDPDIPDGEYVFSSNIIVTVKKNASMRYQEYISYDTYLKVQNNNFTDDEDLYGAGYTSNYEVVWYLSKPARKMNIGDFSLYVYKDGEDIKMYREKKVGNSTSSHGEKVLLLSEAKEKWKLPDVNSTYISETQYDKNNTKYLYAVFADTVNNITFYNDETNTASPSGESNKMANIQTKQWDFTPNFLMTKDSGSGWTVRSMKDSSGEAYISVLKSSTSGGESFNYITCKKK